MFGFEWILENCYANLSLHHIGHTAATTTGRQTHYVVRYIRIFLCRI